MPPSIHLRTLALAAVSACPAFAAWALPCDSTRTLHVSPQGGSSTTAGSSWSDPASLQHALGQANGGALSQCYDIRLMQGHYTPTANASDRAARFAINRPLLLRGGYTGNGDERVAGASKTVLSGDIGGDDNKTPDGITPTATDIAGQNSHHVVVIGGLSSTQGSGLFHATPGDATYTLIERLTITGGRAEASAGPAFPSGYGGGLVCNGLGQSCSPRLHDVQFMGNHAALDGGALISWGQGQPAIVRSTFSGNMAQRGGAIASIGIGEVNAPQISVSRFSNNHTINGQGDGGAIYHLATGVASSPGITDTLFQGNTARRGGAVFNESAASGTLSPNFEGNTFSANSTGTRSWNLNTTYQGGAMANLARGNGSVVKPTITDSTFVDNSAQQYGGAIYSQVLLGAQVLPVIVHSTFWNNKAALGQAILNQATNGAIEVNASGSIVRGEETHLSQTSAAPTNASAIIRVRHSIIGPGGHVGQDNLNADPQLGPLQDNGGPTPTQLPGANSPAIDAVDCTAGIGNDQRDVPRPQGGRCDMGAAERQPTHLLTLQVTGNGIITGSPNLSCGNGNTGLCTADYMPANPPQVVALTAVPGPDQQATWSGECTEDASDPLRAFATMDAAKTCRASFAPATYAIGGTVSHLIGPGLALHNNGETLPISVNGNFSFATRVARGGSYDVSIHAQPLGQRCTIANASGGQVTAAVSSVQVDCAPHFEGTTLPTNGPGGTGSASFTGGGPTCRFDLAQTRFEAAPALPPPGQELPQGMFRFKLVGCTPGSAVRMTVSWPAPVHGYLKHGRDSRTATQDRYYAFAPEHLLAISGNTVHFTVKDGALGDDDWNENGEITDPAGPTVRGVIPAGAHAIPALSDGALALLGLLAACLGGAVLRGRQGSGLKIF